MWFRDGHNYPSESGPSAKESFAKEQERISRVRQLPASSVGSGDIWGRFDRCIIGACSCLHSASYPRRRVAGM